MPRATAVPVTRRDRPWHPPMLRRRSILVPLLLAPLTLRAQTTPNPEQAAAFVRQAGVDLAGVMAGAATPADKQARLEPYLRRVVDEEGVARFCLGRYWQAATPTQRAEYLRLFGLVLLHGVVGRLGDYQAGATTVTVNTPVAKPDGIYVPTVVERAGSSSVKITWMVVTDDHGAMRIGDVVAEGMSLRLSQRSDYASFLSRNGGDVAALIAALRQRVGTE